MRLNPKDRKAAILDKAVELAQEVGYQNVTQAGVAERAGVSRSLVTHYFKCMDGLKREIMQDAIKWELQDIVLQGLAAKCPIANTAPLRLKAKAVEQYSTTVTL